MSTTFVSRDIWFQLTKAVRVSRRPCSAAVAYFGAGASRLLPLPAGSHLVVDASERAVASGQTCPADLIKLLMRGVAIYSVPNLHAKVFVLGRAAYIGSTNVSSRSAAQLVEAVIRTTETSAIRDARKFVRDLCLHELTPKLLKQLAKLYRPPQVQGGRRDNTRNHQTYSRPTLPRVFLAQLVDVVWNERAQRIHDLGLAVAKKRRHHSRRFYLESFSSYDNFRFQRGDVVVQVSDEGGASTLMAPPGNVVHVRTGRDGNEHVSFVYVERPARRRLRVKSVARRVGCAQRRLLEDGVIRSKVFARALLKAWAVV